MPSNFARDIVYQPWAEAAVTALLDAAVEGLVHECDFFARVGPRTEYVTLSAGEAVARHLRMRDACSDAVLTVACVFQARGDGRCSLWLEARRGFFTLDEATHQADMLAMQAAWSTDIDYGDPDFPSLPLPGSFEDIRQRLDRRGSLTDPAALRQWAGCDEFGARICATLAP